MRVTDEEIRAASAEMLQRERSAAADVFETTPAEITPVIRTFAESLSSQPPLEIPVVEDPCGRYGWCSDGVRLKVAADSGQPVHGWTIWEWAPALLTAEFHCVWRSPSGELVDITPKPKRDATIVFVEDPAYPADFDFDKRPRNRRMNCYQPPNRAELVRVLDEKLTGARRAYEACRAEKAGLSLKEWLDRKVPVDPLSGATDELIVICGEFDQHFDSLGASGMVAVDRKLAELGKRRLAVQARFKALIDASKR